MSMQAQYEQWNAKYVGFDVTRLDLNAGKYVRIPGQSYEKVQDAIAATIRLEGGKRYAGQMLFVDIANSGHPTDDQSRNVSKATR